MHSALFVAHPRSESQEWKVFLGFVEAKLATQKGVARLAENVWLVNVHQSPPALGWLLAYAEQQKIAYGLLQIDQRPVWLPDGFDPASIQDRT